jgi:hypothetical protein
VARNVSAIAAGIAGDPSGLGSKRGAKYHGGEGEFGQSFHIFCFLFVIGGGSFEPSSPATSQTRFSFLQLFEML